MIKLNRIGNKLGLAGAVGVLLAVGMVANQMITESTVAEANERAGRSQRVADSSLAAHLDLRKMQLAARDVRLARTPAEVEKIVADLQRFKAQPKRRSWKRAGDRPEAGYQGAAAEDQVPDGQLYRRPWKTGEGADHAAGADRQALGDLG